MASDILERGDIYFVYRPRVEQEQAHDIEDVQRLFVILQPSGSDRSRRLVIGRKHLPRPDEHERFWGFVDEVASRPEPVAEDLQRRTYETRTQGKRTQPAARPAGEGRYAIVRHGSHTHLTYELEMPAQHAEDEPRTPAERLQRHMASHAQSHPTHFSAWWHRISV
ncbi:hypothetical protein [Streptomyces sp. NPDC001792]|uniref:hypothetical protein n=1 Tax=unclassified Streptomyces TaxID=2593676 RepID=UPI00332279DE